MRAFVLLPLLASACAAPRQTVVAVRAPAVVRLPPSALSGAVRALEALETNRPEDALVQVRALESSSLEGHSAPGGLVRVFLHLTVYAQTSERARAGFDELCRALEADSRTPGELEPVSDERARRAVGAPGWAPLGSEELLSYSGALRLEFTPARGSSAAAREASGHAGPATIGPATIGIEEYVRGLAKTERIEMPDLSLRASSRTPGVTEVRCHIQDAPAAAGHSREEIGAFLAGLENGSPAARVTEVLLERTPNEPDPRSAQGWALEALLVVRVPAGD